MSCCCDDPAAGGTGGCCSLAATLAVGNVTGGNDIVESTGDVITSETDLRLLAAAVLAATAGNDTDIEAGDSVDGDAGFLYLRGGETSGQGDGGAVQVIGGDGFGLGGDVDLLGGAATGATGASSYHGGSINLVAGEGARISGDVNIFAADFVAADPDGEAGHILMRAGSTPTGGVDNIAGNIEIGAGDSEDNDAGNVNIYAGTANGAGQSGDVFVSGNGVRLISGQDRWVEAKEMIAPNFRLDIQWRALSNGTTITAEGFETSIVGAANVPALSTASVYRRAQLIEYLDTVASTTALARIRSARRNGFFGRLFDVWSMFGIALGTSNASNQCFTGLADDGFTETAAPSSFQNMIGFGWDAGDTNIQLMSNNNVGSATKQDTGIPRPSSDQSELYITRLKMLSATGLEAWLIRKSTGDMFHIQTSADMPAQDTLWRQYVLANTGGVSAQIGIGVLGMGGVRE